jgi:hypothetical protein
MNEQSLKQSEAKWTGILIDLIRSILMERADVHMRNDEFERSANYYFLAAHMCPVSGDDIETIYGYRIGKVAARSINEDLDYPFNRKITTDTLREYNKYLEENK